MVLGALCRSLSAGQTVLFSAWIKAKVCLQAYFKE